MVPLVVSVPVNCPCPALSTVGGTIYLVVDVPACPMSTAAFLNPVVPIPTVLINTEVSRALIPTSLNSPTIGSGIKVVFIPTLPSSLTKNLLPVLTAISKYLSESAFSLIPILPVFKLEHVRTPVPVPDDCTIRL